MALPYHGASRITCKGDECMLRSSRALIVGLLLTMVCLTSWTGADFLTGSTVQAQVKAAAPIRVVIWDEQQPPQKRAYGGKFLGETIAAYLKTQPGLTVRSVKMDDKDHGLTDDVLDNCDVLIWWSHVRNGQIQPKEVSKIVQRVKEGKMDFIALHSAHWATPFIELMNARALQDGLAKVPAADRAKAKVELVGEFRRRPPKKNQPLSPSFKLEKDAAGVTVVKVTRPNCCFPYCCRQNGRPSNVKTLAPEHPIAKGLPAAFTLKATEMYDGPFHVPAADTVLFEETWNKGEKFPAGMVWAVGKGQVFYFRPGHETFPIFEDANCLKVVSNAVTWMGSVSKK
jgi:trehalose utilization protein